MCIHWSEYAPHLVWKKKDIKKYFGNQKIKNKRVAFFPVTFFPVAFFPFISGIFSGGIFSSGIFSGGIFSSGIFSAHRCRISGRTPVYGISWDYGNKQKQEDGVFVAFTLSGCLIFSCLSIGFHAGMGIYKNWYLFSRQQVLDSSLYQWQDKMIYDVRKDGLEGQIP